jgi:hypothetical protein
MAILTSQKISNYYELFKAIDVIFSKEIIQVTGLVANQVYLKCVGDFWPCVIYSTSFNGAKVVVNTKTGILQKLEWANNMASLRFCFKNAETGNTVTFFVNTKASGVTPYGGSADVVLLNLQFTQRPPDDLIEIMGRILDANVNSAKRKEERIIITPDSIRKLSISKESSILIQGVPRHCILRDISFSGAKIIMMGVAKFLVDKEAFLRLEFEDPREVFLLKGKFIRSESVEGRKELVSLGILFEESIIPMGYKIRVNNFISQIRPETRGAEKGGDASSAKPAPVKAAEAKPAQSPAKAPPKKDDWPSPDEAAKTAPAAASAAKPAPAEPAPAKPAPAKPAPAKPAPAKPADDDFNLDLPV